MKTPTKPKPKSVKTLDWHECTDFIEKKYKCDTRDYAGTHKVFGEWCKMVGEKPDGSSREQYARFKAAIKRGDIQDRPYQDFWHWLLDTLSLNNGSKFTLELYLGDAAEPWQKEILGLYIAEFGEGPYRVEW